MQILITGGSGQVGRELMALAWPEGLEPVAPRRAELDLADRRSIEAWLAGRSLGAILSSGAYTAVDRAESEIAEAWAVNALAPAVLAAHAAKAGIPILHVSTDYVFDGTKPDAYVETDPVGPIGVYGASKEGGEQAVRTSKARHAILRTSWVVSPHGANFVKTMLRVGRERPELRVVADQHGAPTVAADLAGALQAMLLRMLADPAAPSGTYHFANAGETTWHGFAQAIFAAGTPFGGPSPTVTPIATADYPTPARRPTNSRLSAEKLAGDYGIRARPWRDAVSEVVERLLSPATQE